MASSSSNPGRETRDWRARFEDTCARRTAAAGAPLAPVHTIHERAGGRRDLEAIGSPWSQAAFDGPFYQARGDSLGVVFVRSAEGNTGAKNPSSFGGGAVDQHLIYEGLSRVAADGVVVGAGTLHPGSFFSVWRRELIELRAELGRPRHPAQIVLSADGSVRVEDVLLFNVPEVPVFVITSPRGRERLLPALDVRPWITPITGPSLQQQFEALRARGLHRLCSIGGRRSATELVDAGLVRDVYLTTTPSNAGEPDTPWYVGKRTLSPQSVVLKQWDGEDGPVLFEHSQLG
ncbi:MAG TPA: dihydrofolate reductase family protein [Vicinamibacterales bacterium]|nr:dihydrofolate reductase family protein [Vicinamibacterales bacterium]